MGTPFIVKLRHDNEEVRDIACVCILEILDHIDSMMSTCKLDSELSLFNQNQSTNPFKVPLEMIEFFLIGREVSDVTNGAFDVTVGPIVNAWGLGPEKKVGLPTDADIANLPPLVGYKMISIDSGASTHRKGRPEIYHDLSGIAQGIVADKVTEMLKELGIGN